MGGVCVVRPPAAGCADQRSIPFRASLFMGQTPCERKAPDGVRWGAAGSREAVSRGGRRGRFGVPLRTVPSGLLGFPRGAAFSQRLAGCSRLCAVRGWVGFTSSARLRRAVPTGGRRSKRAVPSGPLGFPRGAAFSQRLAGGSLSRAVRGGGVCVVRPPAAGCADRRSAFQAGGAIWTVGIPARGCIFTATGRLFAVVRRRVGWRYGRASSGFHLR